MLELSIDEHFVLDRFMGCNFANDVRQEGIRKELILGIQDQLDVAQMFVRHLGLNVRSDCDETCAQRIWLNAKPICYATHSSIERLFEGVDRAIEWIPKIEELDPGGKLYEAILSRIRTLIRTLKEGLLA